MGSPSPTSILMDTASSEEEGAEERIMDGWLVGSMNGSMEVSKGLSE
jgi:hypothetical protein